jgi:selenocysteine lyase/cysteine desulfurase
VAYRRGRLRVSPHLYNTLADIDRALEVLDTAEEAR